MFRDNVPGYNDLHLQNNDAVRVVRKIVSITAVISVVAALLHSFGWDASYPLEKYFALSTSAVQKLWIWQPLTYMFLNNTEQGLSLLFFISLFFNLYILSLVGLQVANEIGSRAFLKVYFTAGIAAAAVILATSLTLHHNLFFTGNIAPLNALLTIWCLLMPEVELLLLFIFPIKMKWLWLSIIGMQALLVLPVASIAALQAIFIGVIVGYLYAIGKMQLSSPFSALQSSIDPFIVRSSRLLFQLHSKDTESTMQEDNRSKIYDFKTGKAILNDDEFVDVILEKISKQGEKSLTWSERRRMNQIAESKRRS